MAIACANAHILQTQGSIIISVTNRKTLGQHELLLLVLHIL